MTESQSSPDPRFVVVAGDWHRNIRWALHVIEEADELFTAASEPRRIIIQLGDFGFRPTPANPDLITINRYLAARGMELWFIDGNHDYHPDLARLTVDWRYWNPEAEQTPVSVPGFRQIRYLPRGTRWTWRGRRWLAVGGAASVDRLLRTEGVDWWPEEEITAEQEAAVSVAGPADVLLSHDCPAVWVPYDRLGIPADGWLPELPRARAHAERLERIAVAVGVTRVLHGHYHLARDDRYSRDAQTATRVTGLTLDGYPENYQLLDVERM